MKKLSNYIQFGKGRGFRFVFLMSILLSALYGVVIGYAGLQLAKSPVVEDFIDSVPTFSVVDGVAQDRTIRWRSTIPLTEMPFTVDTTQEELSLPVADGIYVTANYIYYVSNYGTKVTRSVIEGSFDVSKEHLNKRVRLYVLSSAVGLTIISSIVSIIFFLVLTAISTIFGLILGIRF